MKRLLFSIILVVLSIVFVLPVGAQTMRMSLDGEVVLQPQDADALSYYPVRDQNDHLCALLKVTVTNKLKNPLVLETGGLGVVKRQEQESGEIWFWLPYQVRNLTFLCSEYQPMNPIPVRLEKGKVYRLTLRTDAQVQTITNAVAAYNFLKFQLEPADADNAVVSVGKTAACELGGEYVSNGKYSKRLDYGEYYYKIEHEFYKTVTGKVRVSEENQTHKFVLEPNYAYLKITSEPSGARVAINGKVVGSTPYESKDRCAAGPLKVRLQATDYALLEETVTVQGNGQLQTCHFALVPEFATVTCVCDRADAEIWVDGQQVGLGTWTGPLSSQSSHLLESRKAGHQPQSVSFTVAKNEVKTVKVGAPVALLGNLVLESVPDECEVWIDGESKGSTPFVSHFLVGKHRVVLKKYGYTDQAFEINVAHNQTVEECRTLVTSQADYGIELVYVQGGTFQMGASVEQDAEARENEGPVHAVTVSDFYMGKYEVTQAQWMAVMGYNPSGLKGDALPVENVSWQEIQQFLERLSATTGKTYRLPTEAEWEYAARGGRLSQGTTYAGSNDLSAVAWFEGNAGNRTHPAGLKLPNELGLYDMSGNVWEWCQDIYGAYSDEAQTNPIGAERGMGYVVRGGCMVSNSGFCRATFRDYNSPNSSVGLSISGFRVVMVK